MWGQPHVNKFLGGFVIKIGEFIEAVQTTKDTVRHYEELGLLQPEWYNTRRIYSEKDRSDFQAIKEMQALHLSLKEIQVIFDIKRNNGCGSSELLGEVIQTLKEKQAQLMKEEQIIRDKKSHINQLITALNEMEY